MNLNFKIIQNIMKMKMEKCHQIQMIQIIQNKWNIFKIIITLAIQKVTKRMIIYKEKSNFKTKGRRNLNHMIQSNLIKNNLVMKKGNLVVKESNQVMKKNNMVVMEANSVVKKNNLVVMKNNLMSKIQNNLMNKDKIKEIFMDKNKIQKILMNKNNLIML